MVGSSVVSTKTMTWNSKTRILSAEVSDVGGWFTEILLVSHTTGKQISMRFVHENHDNERELIWRDYRPFGVDLGLDITLRIFND